ncbi:hypothetical protein, partial [Pseudomonas bubulae]
IKSPITQQVIATYHQKGQDVYVQRISTPTPTLPAVPDIQVALDKAKGFLDDLHSFKTLADEQAAKPTRTAMGIEYLYHQHAL